MTSPRAITALSGAAIAAAVGVAAKRDYTKRIDRDVRKRIHPRRSATLTSVAQGISYLAGPRVHPLVATGLGFLINWKEGTGGFGPGAASLGALAVDNATRLFVHQRRPPKAGPHHGRNRYAYPSGHVTAATAIAIASAGEIANQLTHRERKLLWAAVAAFSVSVGWSRLYLDEHWMDDVVGGWMAGIAIGLGSISLASQTDVKTARASPRRSLFHYLPIAD